MQIPDIQKPRKTAQGARLRPLDPDLPVLAARAAIEVEGIRLGKRPPDKLKAVGEIKELIKNSVAVGRGGTKSLFIDHGAATVIGQSLKWNPKRKTMAELVQEAMQIVGDLEKLQHGKKNTLDRVRNFFVELSKRSAAYREALRGTRPAPPYRQ